MKRCECAEALLLTMDERVKFLTCRVKKLEQELACSQNVARALADHSAEEYEGDMCILYLRHFGKPYIDALMRTALQPYVNEDRQDELFEENGYRVWSRTDPLASYNDALCYVQALLSEMQHAKSDKNGLRFF